MLVFNFVLENLTFTNLYENECFNGFFFLFDKVLLQTLY